MSSDYSSVILETGLYGIKTLVTLNAGAFGIILTFIGNASSTSAFSSDPYRLVIALYAFLAGLAAAFITVGIAYGYAQFAQARPRSVSGWSMTRFLVSMMLPPALGFLLFIAGVIVAISGIQPA